MLSSLLVFVQLWVHFDGDVDVRYDCFYKFLQYLLVAKYGEVCTL